MRDLIIRDRNHPSLVFWEGNNRDLSPEHTKELKDLVAQWDWIAPRPYADRGPYQSYKKSNDPKDVALMDFSMGMNAADYVKTLTNVESEYYRPENPRRCWDDDSPPYRTTTNDYFKTQQQACREFLKGWKKIAKTGGGVKWHFTDDTTHLRVPENSVARLSGPVDATRLPKDMYGALRVLFASDTPETYLMGHWNYEEKKVHTVDVYSTCDEVELFVNDKSLGKKPTEDRWVSWENRLAGRCDEECQVEVVCGMKTHLRSLSELCDRQITFRDPRINPGAVFRYVDISSVDYRLKEIVSAQVVRGSDASVRARQVIKTNDVLVSTVRPNLNAVALVPPELDGQICSTGFWVLRCGPELKPTYLFAFVTSLRFVNGLVELVQGALYPAVTSREVFAQQVPWVELKRQEVIGEHFLRMKQLTLEVKIVAQKQLQELELLPQKLLAQVFES